MASSYLFSINSISIYYVYKLFQFILCFSFLFQTQSMFRRKCFQLTLLLMSFAAAPATRRNSANSTRSGSPLGNDSLSPAILRATRTAWTLPRPTYSERWARSLVGRASSAPPSLSGSWSLSGSRSLSGQTGPTLTCAGLTDVTAAESITVWRSRSGWAFTCNEKHYNYFRVSKQPVLNKIEVRSPECISNYIDHKWANYGVRAACGPQSILCGP